MNKYLLNTVLVLFTCWCSAQNLHVDSNDYASVDSYNGVVRANAYTVWIDGNGSLNMPVWRASVRVKQAIRNSSNQTFPANKISLIPKTTQGQLNPGPVPTISQIGMPLQTILQQGQEVFLVPQAQVGLINDAAGGHNYYQFFMYFDLQVEGGTYLSAFTPYSQFIIPLEFKFYDEKNKVQTIDKTYTFQIGNLGTPPNENILSLKVAPNAKTSLLNLASISDYTQGAQTIVPNGLMVQATTGYQLKVKSLQSTFTSQNGNTLPLATVRLSLIPAANISATLYPVQLSAVSQRIASGLAIQNNNTGYYDIKYSTQANDINLYQAKMETYSTVLQYEITPQ